MSRHWFFCWRSSMLVTWSKLSASDLSAGKGGGTHGLACEGGACAVARRPVLLRSTKADVFPGPPRPYIARSPALSLTSLLGCLSQRGALASSLFWERACCALVSLLFQGQACVLLPRVRAVLASAQGTCSRQSIHMTPSCTPFQVCQK